MPPSSGHLLLFDNGNCRGGDDTSKTGLYSRAAEYELDFATGSASLVFEYAFDDYGAQKGSARRFGSDGHTVRESVRVHAAADCRGVGAPVWVCYACCASRL